jgi:hypothetical protein
MMAFRPNYNQQRSERNRLKQAKMEAKLRERQEATARRKAEKADTPAEPEQANPKQESGS